MLAQRRVRQVATGAVCALMLGACTSSGNDASSPGSSASDNSSPTTSTEPVISTEPSAPTTATSTTSDTSSTSPSTSPPATLSAPTVQLYDIGEFNLPVGITSRVLDSRVFVVEQDGQVIALDDLSSETVLDLGDAVNADGERGLLGLAFHPTLDLAYINYTDSGGQTVVAEFEIDPETAVFDDDSFREVLTITQPFPNHNGGSIEFGPDDLLYIGVGDGGSAEDPNRNALDLSSPLGKLLRIDPVADGQEPYTVPADNPFVGVDGADETIWSIGLRNPWRFSFDPVTGDLWIADVGQGAVEEINWALATDGLNAGRGENFGWSAFEGHDRFNDDQVAEEHSTPVYVYTHEEGRCSISGGVRYRGESIPELAGWYVFGDYCTGEIWALDPNAPFDSPRIVDLGQLDGLAAISQGPERGLYAVSNSGAIARFGVAD